VLLVYGTSLTNRLRSGLIECGFVTFIATDYGFCAAKAAWALREPIEPLKFRDPLVWERFILDRLLAESFIGFAEIRRQLSSCLVSEASQVDGGFELLVTDLTLAPVVARVPATIAAYDVDKVPISVDLHVVSGIAYMVQILKADGTNIIQLPQTWSSLSEVIKSNG
jgi:hypothetical protein